MSSLLEICNPSEVSTSLRLILCSLLQIPSLLQKDFTEFLIKQCLALESKSGHNDAIIDIIELCLYDHSLQDSFQSNVDQIITFFNGKSISLKVF